MACNAWGETSVFVPAQGYLRPSLFEGSQKGREVGAVFQNPARLAKLTDTQFKVESSNDYFGYDDFSTSFGARTTAGMSFGLGYQWFGTSGIPSVQRIVGEKPTQTGTFAHDFKVLSFNLAQYVSPKMALGVSVRQMYQSLESDSAEGFSGDFGLYYHVSDYVWFGAYTRYLTSSDFFWESSGVKESLDPVLNIESGLDRDPYYVRFMADKDFGRVLFEWGLMPSFSVQIDSVWNSNFHHQRLGYGALIELGAFALSFLHLHYSQTDFGLDQNYFGLLYRFGGV
jgi:hypothetical protein